MRIVENRSPFDTRAISHLLRCARKEALRDPLIRHALKKHWPGFKLVIESTRGGPEVFFTFGKNHAYTIDLGNGEINTALMTVHKFCFLSVCNQYYGMAQHEIERVLANFNERYPEPDEDRVRREQLTVLDGKQRFRYLPKRTERQKKKEDKVRARYQNATKLLIKWQRKLKLAKTKIQRYERMIKDYERRYKESGRLD